MTTVLDLITDSLQDAGILAAEEAPSAVDAQKAFRLLNRMLDSWSTESLIIYDKIQEVFNLTSGQQTYTMGSGGNFNTSRPIKILNISMRDANNNDLPVEIIDQQQYAEIISKTVSTSLALSAYVDYSAAYANITVWPIVTGSAYRIVIWSWKPLTAFTNVADTISFPPGYEEAIVSNLAIRCCNSWQSPIPQFLPALAESSKAQIKRINQDIPLMNIFTSSSNNSTFPISPYILSGV